MITKEKKAAIQADHGRTKTDTGSPEVQISIMSARILELTEHLKANPKDFMCKRGLMQQVGKRKKLLTYLAETNPSAYTATVKKLGLRK
jgi:small subunit ribosomal protein S15